MSAPAPAPATTPPASQTVRPERGLDGALKSFVSSESTTGAAKGLSIRRTPCAATGFAHGPAAVLGAVLALYWRRNEPSASLTTAGGGR